MARSSPEAHPILGHLPAINRDPLGFLLECAGSGADIVPLRAPFLRGYLLLDPDLIERVHIADHRNYGKPFWLKAPAVLRLLGDGLVTSDGDDWREQRRVCGPAFLPALIPDYSLIAGEIASAMADRWHDGDEIDIVPELTRCTLEMIGRAFLGTDISGEAAAIGDCMSTMMECFAARQTPFDVLGLPPSLPEVRAVRRLDTIIDGIVERARSDKAAKETLFAGLCKHAHSAKSSGNPKRLMREWVKTFLAAGHESSALTLAWTFILLAQNPGADSRLQFEIRERAAGRPLDSNLVPDLPYAEAVLKESLRLYPPLWMTGRRALFDTELSGVKIQRHDMLLTSQWAVQRLPRWFAEPDGFKPERWLDGSLKNLPRFAYFPFGGGPRICIGLGFAQMETVLLLAAVARKFRLELLDNAPIVPWAAMTLRPPKNLKMRVIAQ